MEEKTTTMPFEEAKHYELFKSAIATDLSSIQENTPKSNENKKETSTPVSQNYIG